MLRHVIAPAYAFAQIPNVILRHPRLSSDAKNLLTWQLSLPSGEKQCLSDTARQAGIKKCAFQKAKRQLLDEGYLHQWTVRVEEGRFATVQLIANTPLSVEDAVAVRDGVCRHEQPSAGKPAAGEPTRPAIGRQPKKNTRENTSQPTTPEPGPGPRPEPASRPEPGPRLGEAEALLRSLAHREPRLAMPARTARSWAPLAASWLASGLTPDRVRHALTEGLASARSPLGALRWRLEHALPDIPSPRRPSAQPAAPRLTGMRECRTRHTQPRLFRPSPGDDETLCPDCRPSRAPEPPPSPGHGFAEFLAARQAKGDRPEPGRSGRRCHPPAREPDQASSARIGRQRQREPVV